ncbi:hypothetical protein HDV62DRAFT_59531 [Trichoderma sp. SZMC 28011]
MPSPVSVCLLSTHAAVCVCTWLFLLLWAERETTFYKKLFLVFIIIFLKYPSILV